MSPELYQTLLNHKAIAYYNDLTDVCSAPAVGLMNPDLLRENLQKLRRDKLNIHLVPREERLPPHPAVSCPSRLRVSSTHKSGWGTCRVLASCSAGRHRKRLTNEKALGSLELASLGSWHLWRGGFRKCMIVKVLERAVSSAG